MFSNSCKLNRCSKIGQICETAHGPSSPVVQWTPFKGCSGWSLKVSITEAVGETKILATLLKGASFITHSFPFLQIQIIVAFPVVSTYIQMSFYSYISVSYLDGLHQVIYRPNNLYTHNLCHFHRSIAFFLPCRDSCSFFCMRHI